MDRASRRDLSVETETMAAKGLNRRRVVARGVVQGVGFRPFVHRLATSLGLAGWVLNSTEGVIIDVEGAARALDSFVTDLRERPPARAVVESVEWVDLPPVGHRSFTIEESRGGGSDRALIPPDIATCDECLAELASPGDRRHRYPFINCTNCGPRYTIVKGIPYDRPETTMARFAMCPACAAEYHDPGDRRFHAQPVACPRCGPQVALTGRDGRALAERDGAIREARRALSRGLIVAVKGLGGFHLACDAASDGAVEVLRQRKRRVEKPFAVMCAGLETVERLAVLTDGDRQLLSSPQRPIVLVEKRAGGAVSSRVAPRNSRLGVMLAYTPLHRLLLEADPADPAPPVLVMTSGNRSEEPIARTDAEAYARLADLADLFLVHDREIHVACDDSVTQVLEGREVLRRRSRGYAPFPVRLPVEAPSILAVGAHLKNTFCLTRGAHAFVSQHIGDLENEETLEAHARALEHMTRLFRIEPRAVAHDLHPDYLSTRLARERARALGKGTRVEVVQHHHAHIASCLADNGLDGPAIGVAFDGTGHGTDGAVWGGELLVADLVRFERVGHLRATPMPGGEAAIGQPWRMAASYLRALPGDLVAALPWARRVDRRGVETAWIQAERGLNAPLTTSAGRLFDAVSSILGLTDVSTFEGQAAIDLEMAAAGEAGDAYPWTVADRPGPIVLDWEEPLTALVADAARGVDAGVASARFHEALARAVVSACVLVSRRTGHRRVALSGGVFQNVRLLGRTLALLSERGLEPLVQRQVPCNDGGISLGQAAVAAARLAGSPRPSRRRKRHVSGRAGQDREPRG